MYKQKYENLKKLLLDASLAKKPLFNLVEFNKGLSIELEEQLFNTIQDADQCLREEATPLSYKKSYFNLLAAFLQLPHRIKELHSKYPTYNYNDYVRCLTQAEKTFYLDKSTFHDVAFVKMHTLIKQNAALLNIEGIEKLFFKEEGALSIEEANEAIAIEIYNHSQQTVDKKALVILKQAIYYYLATRVKSSDQFESVIETIDALPATTIKEVTHNLSLQLGLSPLSLDDFNDYVMIDIINKKKDLPGSNRSFLFDLIQLSNSSYRPEVKEFILQLNESYKASMKENSPVKCQQLRDFLTRLNAFNAEVLILEENCKLVKNPSPLFPEQKEKAKSLDPAQLQKQADELKKKADNLQTQARHLFGGDKPGSKKSKLLGLSLMVIGGILVLAGLALSIPLTPLVGIPIKAAGGACFLVGASLAGVTGLGMFSFGLFKSCSAKKPQANTFDVYKERCDEAKSDLRTENRNVFSKAF